MSKKLKELRDKRGAKVERLQAIGGTLETRSLTQEEMTEYGSIQSELRGMDSEIQVLAETQALALALAAESGGEITSSEKRELKRFSIMRGLQLLASGLPLDGIEKEVHDTAAAAARSQGVNVQGFAVPAFLNQRGQTVTLQTVNPGDQGGVTVETQVNGLIEALWSQSFLSQVGARRLVGLSGNQLFPVQLTKPVAQERTEIQTLTDQEILFGSVAMSPTRRGVTIPVSKQLMLQSSIDIEAFVIDMIRRSLDYKLNQDAITELLANITTANGNLLEIGTNGGALTYAHLVALETLLASADVTAESVRYLTNSKMRGKMKGTEKFSTTGLTLWEPGNEANGYPVTVSNIVPSNLTKGTAVGVASAVIFGDFSDLYVGMWGGVDFVVDPYTLAKNAQVQITANMFWNTKVVRPASFSGIKDALSA